MKCLVSFSNFKGTLSNSEACEVACDTLRKMGLSALSLPLGDGGKGTFSFLENDPRVHKKSYQILGAFSDPREGRTLWRRSQSGVWQVFLESTDAIGYPPSNPERRDPLGATSRGLGQWLLLIQEDLGGEACELFLGLGDSAISDAGRGMLEILENKRFPEWKMTVLCDVDNPLCGERGSARVFAPQKGATAQQVEMIETRNTEFANEMEQRFGIQVAQMPRTGSAGGLGAALHVFLGGQLVSGAEFVLSASGFDEVLKEQDLLIVGEGKSDFQTLSGKSPWAAIQRAEKLGKQSILISGALGAGFEKIAAPGLVSKIACGKDPEPKTALKNAVERAITDFLSGLHSS